jgi:hypothetical protein
MDCYPEPEDVQLCEWCIKSNEKQDENDADDDDGAITIRSTGSGIIAILCCFAVMFSSIITIPCANAMIILTVSNTCVRNLPNYPSACVMRTDECINCSSEFWHGVTAGDPYPTGSFTDFSVVANTQISFRHCLDQHCSLNCTTYRTEEMADYLSINDSYMLYDHTKRCVELVDSSYTVYASTCGGSEWCNQPTPINCQAVSCLEDFCVAAYENGTCLANAQCTGTTPLIAENNLQTQSSSTSAASETKLKRAERIIYMVMAILGCGGVVIGAFVLVVLNMRDSMIHSSHIVEQP